MDPNSWGFYASSRQRKYPISKGSTGAAFQNGRSTGENSSGALFARRAPLWHGGSRKYLTCSERCWARPKIPHSKAPRKSHRRFDLFDSFWTGTGSLSHHGILGGLMDLATLWFQQETLDCKRITSARKKWAITISQNVGYIHIHNILMNMYILAFTCHSKGLDTEIWFLIKLEMQLREEILHHLG